MTRSSSTPDLTKISAVLEQSPLSSRSSSMEFFIGKDRSYSDSDVKSLREKVNKKLEEDNPIIPFSNELLQEFMQLCELSIEERQMHLLNKLSCELEEKEQEKYLKMLLLCNPSDFNNDIKNPRGETLLDVLNKQLEKKISDSNREVMNILIDRYNLNS